MWVTGSPVLERTGDTGQPSSLDHLDRGHTDSNKQVHIQGPRLRIQ